MFIPIVTFGDVQAWVCVDAPNDRMFILRIGRLWQSLTADVVIVSLATGEVDGSVSLRYQKNATYDDIQASVERAMKEQYPEVESDFWWEDHSGDERWI